MMTNKEARDRLRIALSEIESYKLVKRQHLEIIRKKDEEIRRLEGIIEAGMMHVEFGESKEVFRHIVRFDGPPDDEGITVESWDYSHGS